jgi:hypothetical protein
MSGRLTTRSTPAGLAAVLLLTGCAGSVSPAATQTAASPAITPAAGGHVIHMNLDVPLASAATLGSACGAADLRATGPKAATTPGSRLQLFDFNRANAAMTPLGDEPVPPTGLVAKPISDDPSFPTACRFSFDVPTTADVDKAYLFALGSISFPVPVIPRADLEAAGWVANIGVNPQ